MPDAGTLRVERRGDAALITIAVPERRNALSRALLAELASAVTQTEGSGARALILTGAGDTFSAGADLRELNGDSGDVVVDDAVAEAVEAVRAVPLPVLAAIEGPCMGAALDLAVACDVRVGGAGARIGVPAARLGLLYNPAAIARMSRTLPRSTVARLLMLGEPLTAEGALGAGVLDEVVDAGTALERCLELAEHAAAGAPAAVSATKALLRALADGEFDPVAWHSVRTELLDSPERRARVLAARAGGRKARPVVGGADT